MLTEHRMKGRSPYAEYQFTFECGTKRRLSARDKMSIKVNQLVKDYEDWHVDHVGAYSTDYIAEQHEYAASDDEEQDMEDWQEPWEKQEELDEESEPECLDDLATCREISEKELELRGLINYDQVRNIATWHADVLKDFARFGDVRRLPTVSEDIRRLAGQPVLVYENNN